MKCPFITTVVKKTKVDTDGKVIGEEVIETIERAECMREECMVYDSANASCSLFNTNQKTNQILSEVKKSGAEISKALFERTETLGVIYSTNFQTLQDALLAKLDLIRKSNEILVMGMDRATGSMEKTIESIEKLLAPITATSETGKELAKLFEVKVNDIKNSLGILSTDMKALFITLVNEIKNGLAGMSEGLKKELAPLIDDTKGIREAHTQLVQSSVRTNSTLAEVGKTVDLLDAHLNNLLKELTTTVNENIKGEIAPLLEELKNGRTMSEQLVKIAGNTIGNLNEMSSRVGQLGEQLVQSQGTNMTTLSEILRNVTAIDDHMSSATNEIGASIVASVQQILSLGGKLEDVNKRLEMGQKQDLVSFEHVTKSIDDLNGVLGKSFETFNNFAQQQNEVTVSIMNQFKSLEEGLHAMSDEGDTQLRDIFVEIEKIHSLLLDRLEIYKAGLEGMLALAKKGFDRNADSIDELKSEYHKTAGSLVEAARSIRDTEVELKNFTGSTAEALNENITRVTKELSSFQIELTKYIKENIGRFSEVIEHQKGLAEGTKNIYEEMSQLFRKQEEQLREQARITHLNEAQLHNDRAIILFHRGNYEAAHMEIKEALKIDETSEYYNNLALILSELGNLEKSRDAYKKAIELAPEFSEIYNNLGLLYMKLKDYDNAITTFGEATKRNINYSLAYTNLGHAFAAKENFDEAIKAWEKALAIDPSNSDAADAVKLYKEGRIDGYTEET